MSQDFYSFSIHSQKAMDLRSIFRNLLMKYSYILLLLLITFIHTYKLQKNVLTLVADDFPDIFTKFPQIVILFCTNDFLICKKTTTFYHQIAKQYNLTNSEVQFGKIDAGQYSVIRAVHNVNYYPTIIYFVRGQKIQYRGQSNKEDLVAWLNKKVATTVKKIDLSALESLAGIEKESIVFHGDLSSNEHRVMFEQLALADDYNDYYNVQVTDLPHGTVQIFRPFGEPASTLIDKNLKSWITIYAHPVVTRFNNQTFADLFHNKVTSIILFEPENISQQLSSAFKEVAENVKLQQNKPYLFINIEVTSEHHNKLSNAIKIDPTKSPIIIFDASKGHKYVLNLNASDLTSQKISTFISDFQNQKLTKYTIEQDIVSPKKIKSTEQL